MKKLLFALLLLCMFCTCKKDIYSSLCGGKNPIKNLPWLKAKIDTLQKYPYHYNISRGEYQGQTLYFISIECCAACSCLPAQPFDCDGNVVKLTESQYNDIFFKNQLLKNQILWHK